MNTDSPDHAGGVAVCGVYSITHRPTGYVYIGSSSNLYRRINHHKSMLRLGTHFIPILQKLYQDNQDVEYCWVETIDVDEARNIEQFLLFAGRDYALFLNRAIDAYHSFKNLKHTEETKRKISEKRKGVALSEDHRAAISKGGKGRIVSDETRALISQKKKGVPKPESVREILQKSNELKSKIVQVGDITYPSAAAAGRAYGVDTKTIHNRVNSTTDKFKDWSFVSNGEKVK